MKRILFGSILLLFLSGLIGCSDGGSGGVDDSSQIAVTYSTNPAIYTKEIDIISNTPTFTGGTATLFTVSPTLPAGLSLNTTTGVITGRPTSASAANSYTVTATTSSGNASVTISIRVSDTLLAPSISYSGTHHNFTAGTAITTVTPTNTGGAPASWIISPDLPAGLNFNTDTGVITGTPSDISPATTYTITATNATNNDTATLSITVIGGDGNTYPTQIDLTEVVQTGNVFYVDPSSGAIGNNGIESLPWNTFQAVIENNKIESREPVSYPYVEGGELKAKNAGAPPVKAGDTIILFGIRNTLC